MTPETEAKLNKVLDDMRNNHPQFGSDRFFTGASYDITTGTELTVTFTLNPEWITHLVKAYADARTDCTYKWIIDGKSYALNEVEFYKGRIVSQQTVSLIVLKVANASGSTQTVDYYVQGWGDRREGL